MPIQFPDFQRISFDEANPLLTGMNKGQDMMQKFLQFPQEMQAKILANEIAKVNAKYAEPMAGQALTKAQQENQWNPKIWQSEIGLRGAQTGLAGAQTGLTSTEAKMNQLKLNYLSQMLGGQGSGNQQRGSVGSNSSANSGYSYDGQGNNIPASQGEINRIAQNGNGMPSQQNNMQPQSNQSFYGIDVPQPNQSDIANSMLLGIDTFSPKRENAKNQVQDQYKQYQKGISDSIHEANAANNLNQAMSVFNNAMDKSFYKGQRLGHLPSSGLLSPPGDLSSEQEADRSALQMLPAAIETLKDAMGNARFSNLDMAMSSKMKFDRTMNDETRALQTQWLQGVNNRMIEKSKFMTAMGNPQSGAMKSDADILWSQYQQDFPLISQDGKTFLGSNLSNWPLYTTPKAIASVKTRGTYTPSAKEKNVYMMSIPDGRGGYQVVPVKKGRVESAFKKGARPL